MQYFSFALLSVLCIAFLSAFAVPSPSGSPCSEKGLMNLPIPELFGAPTFLLVEIGNNAFAAQGVKHAQSKDLWCSFEATQTLLYSNRKATENGGSISKYVIVFMN